MTPSRLGSTRRAKSSANGVAVSIFNAWPGSKNTLAAGDRRAFPPSVMVEIKALACELPSRRGLPLAHWSLSELRREAIDRFTSQLSSASFSTPMTSLPLRFSNAI